MYPFSIFRLVTFVSIHCFLIKLLPCYPRVSQEDGTFTIKKIQSSGLIMRLDSVHLLVSSFESDRSKKEIANVHIWPKKWLIFLNMSSSPGRDVNICRQMLADISTWETIWLSIDSQSNLWGWRPKAARKNLFSKGGIIGDFALAFMSNLFWPKLPH